MCLYGTIGQVRKLSIRPNIATVERNKVNQNRKINNCSNIDIHQPLLVQLLSLSAVVVCLFLCNLED